MPQRWALQLAIEGDGRFVSHLDSVRCIERTAARAKLKLRFSQGFNPRPILSLPCPRPVGVATRDDLLVLHLDEPIEGDVLASCLNRHAPKGMRLNRPILLPDRKTPQPRRITCELTVDEPRRPAVSDRIEVLRDQAAWPVERAGKLSRSGRPKPSRSVDLRAMLAVLELDRRTLRWQAVAVDATWPRVGEVLALVGMDAQVDLAGVTRTEVLYEPALRP